MAPCGTVATLISSLLPDVTASVLLLSTALKPLKFPSSLILPGEPINILLKFYKELL